MQEDVDAACDIVGRRARLRPTPVEDDVPEDTAEWYPPRGEATDGIQQVSSAWFALKLKSAVHWNNHTRTVERQALTANLVADVGYSLRRTRKS